MCNMSPKLNNIGNNLKPINGENVNPNPTVQAYNPILHFVEESK